MNKKLISIIIPVYNVENYLIKCLESIINQTYKDIEIILVDDGATDSSGEICDLYKAKDKRISVFHKKNGGLSDARNFGLDRCTGEYITFLDSDDYVDESYIEKMYVNLLETESDISICNFEKVYDDDFKSKEEKSVSRTLYLKYEALERLFDREVCAQFVVAWGKLYKKELFKTIRFPLGKIHEDEFTTYKVLHGAKKIVYTDEKLVYYIQRGDSIIGQGFNLKAKKDLEKAYLEQIDFYKKENHYEFCKKTKVKLYDLYFELVNNTTGEEQADFLKKLKNLLLELKKLETTFKVKYKILKKYYLYCFKKRKFFQ